MTTSEEHLPPNYAKLDLALRSIGYSFEVAVADVIDNSIDAQARNISVRFLLGPDGRLDLAIYDDGHGMNEDELREAMRFGSDLSAEMARLGKFGLGLKLASLSQATEVTVISGKAGRLAGRAWLEHGISKDFTSSVYSQSRSEEILRELFPGESLRPSGTVVWWSRLYRVSNRRAASEQDVQKLVRRLEKYLALAFHRFLSGRARKVRIMIDVVDRGTRGRGVPMILDPLDPFGYSAPGVPGFPKELIIDDGHTSAMKLMAHIWPPNSSLPGYKLPGGANSAQGFYFYRNNRLISGGGWNGIRDTEPHSSLARVEIDLAPNIDIEVNLDVKKVEIQLPPRLIDAIKRARSTDGLDFKAYLSAADKAYRTRPVIESDLPLIPSTGLPAKLIRFLQKELRHSATAKRRNLRIAWKKLDDTLFFDIDQDRGQLYLNATYRKQVLHGLSGSSADAPLLKCAVFLLLEDVLSSERLGSRMRERTEKINRVLVEAVNYERF